MRNFRSLGLKAAEVTGWIVVKTLIDTANDVDREVFYCDSIYIDKRLKKRENVSRSLSLLNIFKIYLLSFKVY